MEGVRRWFKGADKFYKNLIKGGWSKGRRNQTKAKVFDCEKEGFEIVPYFDFDQNLITSRL